MYIYEGLVLVSVKKLGFPKLHTWPTVNAVCSDNGWFNVVMQQKILQSLIMIRP